MSLLVGLVAVAALAAASPEPPAPHGPPVTEHASPSTQVAAPAGGTEAPHGGAPAHGASRGHGPGDILIHHVSDVRLGHLKVGGIDMGPTKHLVFIVVAGSAVLLMLRLAIRSYGKGGIPTGLGALVETMLVFIRDEIAEKNIGHDGRKYTPLLASFFFFILFAALIGLIPTAATPTGNVSVTLALATISFLATQWAGISKYGVVHHFVGMVPPGMPWPLVIIMIPVELLGMFARPFALTVRLFANMLAGHMVITTLVLLIPLMAGVTTFAGAAMIPVSMGLGLFIMFLEVLVAFLQAFIFTLLSSIFIGMAAHPAH